MKVRTRVRDKIWKLIVHNEGLNGTEIGERLGKDQSTVSKHLKILEDTHYVKVKFDDSKGGVAKRYYPSFRFQFEAIAKQFGKEFPDEVYENIDKLLLDKEIKPILIEISPKIEGKVDEETLVTMYSTSFIKFMNPKIQMKVAKIIAKRKDLQKPKRKGMEVFLKSLDYPIR